jgi:hypothetical protein
MIGQVTGPSGLTAEQKTRAQQLRDREVGSGFDQEIEASDSAARYIQDHDQRGLAIVVTDRRAVRDVADDVRPYALEWGERVLILGGEGRLGQVTPPA